MKKGESVLKRSFTAFNDESSVMITVLVFALSIFGLFAVYSASYYQANSLYGDKFLYLKKQAVGVAIGSVFFMIAANINKKYLKKVYIAFPILCALLLILVFVPKIGVENYGAKRWINLGFFTIQPSELCKLAIVLFSAEYFEKNHKITPSFKGVLPIFIVGGIFALLIIIEPNLSVTVDIALITYLIALAAGLDKKLSIILLSIGIIAIPVLIYVEPYRMARLAAFLDPWQSPKAEGYQLIQSLYGISNGGLFGTGYLNSRQAKKFLPFSESDFIFSVIAEEFGLFGCFVLMSIYLLLIIIGYKKAGSSSDRYDFMLAFSGTSVIAVQVIINIAVVTGSIPPTGLPLPFISSGNTQIIVFMTISGLIVGTNTKSRFAIK